MKQLLDLWSLIKKLVELLLKLFRKEEKSPTREEFIEAVKELSKDPVWRARILKDALTKMREMMSFDTTWISKDDITLQTLHRNFGCGVSFSFGDGNYAMPEDQWYKLIQLLQQDSIKYVSQFTDCDNFATFFKGFADYVVGKEVVIYTTGLVFREEEFKGHKYCPCDSDHLIGGHAWNRILTIEPIKVEKTGTKEVLEFNFTVYNYEPQSDVIGDVFMGKGRCYKSGGGLPVIYGKKEVINNGRNI